MTDRPHLSLWQRFGVPRAMVWTGIAATAALFGLFYVTRAEAIQGQLADLPAMILIVVALVIGSALQSTALSARLVEFVARPRSPAIIALAVLGLLAIGTLLVFGTGPLSGDEKVNLFQARLFAQFKLVANYPPGLVERIVAPGYENNTLVVASDGRVMSVLWPGWALLMTPFVWLGVPWLLGPATASLGIYVVGRIATLLSGARAAALAILLALTSGAFLVTGMSVYPSGAHMTLSLLFAWLLLRGGRRDMLLAGLVGGFALNLNNPLPHAAFAFPWVVWLLVDPSRRGRILPLAAGYAPWLVIFGGWYLLESSFQAAVPGSTGGFWLARVAQIVSVPSVAILGDRFWELVRAWAWSAPGLLVLAAVAWRRESRMSGAWVLGLCFGMVVLAYVFFPDDQGLGWGARYYHTAWGALPILAALLLVRPGMEAVARVAVVAAIVGLVVVVPIQFWYAHSLADTDQAAQRSVQTLSAPGVDLYFINVGPTEDSSLTLWDDPSLTGQVVFVSEGAVADQALVDRWFPGARLVVSNSSGSGWEKQP